MNWTSQYYPVFKNRGFLNLWINQILVQLAYNSLNFALVVWVFQLTGSSLAVAFLVSAIYLPGVIVGLFAGVFVDLLDRKNIISSINLALSLLVLSLVLLKDNVFAVLGVAFLANVLAQFYIPAEASAIPMLVPKKSLFLANSLFSMTLFAMFLVGFSVGGPLIDFFGIDMVFWFGGSVLLLAFLLSSRLPKMAIKPDKQGLKLLDALRRRKFIFLKKLLFWEIENTLLMVRGRLPVLVPICILAGVQGVIAILAVTVPFFLERALKISATGGSYILVLPMGIGMILGGVLLGKVGGFIPRRRLVGCSVMFGGLLFFLLGALPMAWPVVSRLKPLPFVHQPSLSAAVSMGSFLLGLAMIAIIVPSQTALQENSIARDRGKVFSILGAGMSILGLVAALGVGILTDFFGSMPIFIALGGTVALLGFLSLKPDFFFDEGHLPYKLRQFLGLGHWKRR